MSSVSRPDALAKRLGYVLKRAQHALRIRMDEALSPLKLTTPQYSVLTAVELEPGISNAALARSAFMTAQSMQGIVANLESMGLLQREADLTHGRIRRGKLTKPGRNVLVKAHVVVAEVEAKMTAGLASEEITLMATLLARCADNLRQASGD